ncbi:MAG: NUDIX domain-containing protein [Thermoplasmata archaeon]
MPTFAHFDAQDPLEDAMCVSAFLISANKDGILAGRMKDPKAWSSLDRVSAMGLGFREDLWVLPAGHLHVGEHPDAAAERIASDQLRARLRDLRLWHVLSYAEPMPSRNQDLHWDLCFVYKANLEVPAIPPWFSELRRLPLSKLSSAMFARGHGEIVEELALFPEPWV